MFQKVKNVVLLIIAVLGFVFAGPTIATMFRSQQAMSALRAASATQAVQILKDAGRLVPNVSGSIIALAVERCLKEAETGGCDKALVAACDLILEMQVDDWPEHASLFVLIKRLTRKRKAHLSAEASARLRTTVRHCENQEVIPAVVDLIRDLSDDEVTEN